MALDNTGTDVPENIPGTDVPGKPNAGVDTPAKVGADVPKTYTEEEYKALQNESVGRRKEIDTLKVENTDLTGKVSKLAAIVSGDESADADIDPEVLAEQFKNQTKLLEDSMQTTLLKANFIEKATKAGFQDPDVAFNMINEKDPRLDVSIVTQTVTGIDEVIADLVEKAPWAIKGADGDDPPVKPPPSSVKAPGSPPPAAQTGSENAQALEKLQVDADEYAKKHGNMEGAIYYLNKKQERGL